MDQNHNVSMRPENGQPPPTSSCGPKVDKAKFAGKGADLLHTASSFGKGKKLGKYLGKAENYLRKYQNTHTTNTPHGYPGQAGQGPATTVPLGHPPSSDHHGDPGRANTVPLGHPPTSAHHGDPGRANTVPLGHPPPLAHHGYPPSPTEAPHGHPAATATVPPGYPPARGSNGDSANAVPIAYPPGHPGGNGYAGGVHGNSGSGFGDYLKKASGFLKKY